MSCYARRHCDDAAFSLVPLMCEVFVRVVKTIVDSDDLDGGFVVDQISPY